MGVRAVLENVDTLPRPQRSQAIDNGYTKACVRQCGTDMRGHIVRTFGRVAVIRIVFGHEAFEEVAQVERYAGIGVLLNHERAGSVLNENREQSVCDFLFGEPILKVVSEGI